MWPFQNVQTLTYYHVPSWNNIRDFLKKLFEFIILDLVHIGSFHFGVYSYWDWISWSLTPHFWFLKICGVLHTTQKVNDLISNTLENSRLVQTLLATLVVCTSCLEHDALLYGSCSFCHHVIRLSKDLWRNRWCTPLDLMCQNDPWVGGIEWLGQNIFCGFVL